MLCNVGTKDLLLQLWLDIVAAGKKRDQFTLEQTPLQIALGADEMCPKQRSIVMVDLIKKLMALNFTSDNLNDLGDGIQPFVLTVCDFVAVTNSVPRS